MLGMPYSVSISVNRVAITPHRFSNFEDSLNVSDRSMQNLSIKPNAFIMSKSARKRLQDRVMTMYQIALPRTKFSTSKKRIDGFRCAFITLTLPFKQMHTDKEVKALFLDQLLIELRHHYNMKNYVWKAELQKNENIHFHLITDSFIQFHAVQKRWNRILNKGGYIDAYVARMSKLSFDEYFAQGRKYNKNLRWSTAQDRYNKGVSSGWRHPNSVDVRNIRNSREMSVYMSKYVSKPVTESTDLERGADFGRAWFCSRSVSNLVTQLKGNYTHYLDLYTEIGAVKDSKEFIGDFFTVLYFRISSIPRQIAGYIESWLRYRNFEQGYYIEGYG